MSKELHLALTGDFHITNGTGTELSHAMLDKVVDSIGSQIPDAVLVVGDMVHTGSVPATERVARAFSRVTKEEIPVIAVLGNHDRRNGNISRKKHIYRNNGIIILDGDAFSLKKRGEKEKCVGILGVTGGFDGSLYTGEKVYPLPTMIGCDLNASLAALRRLLETTPYPDNIILTHFNAGFPTMSYTQNRYALTAGSVRTEALIHEYRSKIRAVVHGHTHRATMYGKIEGVDVIAGSMQVSLRDARLRNRNRVTARDFYTMYTVKL